MEDPVSDWLQARKKTIEELRSLGRQIKWHAKNAKIASAVGSGVSVVTGAGAVASIIAAPFTAGASLGFLLPLTGGAIAGGATSVGSSVVNYFIENGCLKRVQEVLDDDKSLFEKLKKALVKIQEMQQHEKILGTVLVAEAGAKAVALVARHLAVAEVAAVRLLNIARGAQILSKGLTVVALPIDAYVFINDILDLVNDNISEAADKVFKKADDLEKERSEIMAFAK